MEGPVEQRSLKDKFKDHWNTRDQIWSPNPQKANKMGMAFSWCYAGVILYSMVCVLLPGLGHLVDTRTLFISKILAVYVVVSAMINWYLATNLKSSQADQDSVTETQQDWQYCVTCQIKVPPRTHHCKACNVCVLKRDHHCFFTGNCVGWANQRRFIVFVWYAFIGCIYGMTLILTYLIESEEPWSQKWYNYLPAISFYAWIIGSIPLGHYLLLLELHASVIVLFTAGGFTLWEMCLVFRGQTSYEAAKGIGKYRTGPLDGFRSVFGNYGFIHFIVPLSLPLTSDGTNWPLYKQHKAH